ncbi:MAG: PilN domain-containing protein [Hyphomicrobiaceae bacterium]
MSSHVSGFLAWWGRELAGMLPAGGRPGDAQTTPTVIGIGPAGWTLVGMNGPKDAARPEGAVPAQVILAYLASRLRTGSSPGAIALRLPHEACFVRRLELPDAARADFGQLLAMDLERTTPFKARDVVTAFDVEDALASKGMARVRQFIVKRRLIDGPKAEIEALGLKVLRVECADPSGDGVVPVNFLAHALKEEGGPKPSHMLVWLLAACVIGLAASGLWIYAARHEQALRTLQDSSAKLKGQVQRQKDALIKTQSAFAEIASYQKLRSETASKVVILEELTRILPETAWITDLKIDGGTIDISGLAVSAAALVPILERSKVFVDASSTAALTLDPREEKERFSIRARIRNAAPVSNEVLQ